MGAVWKVSGCNICRLYVGCVKGGPDPVALTFTLNIDVVTKDRPLAM